MEKEAITLTATQRFWRLLKPDQKEIRNVYVYSIFNGLINLSLPLGIQAIINLIQGGLVSTSWIVLVFFVVAGIAFAGILQIYQLRITESIQQKIFARAAFEFAYRIPKIKMERLYQHYAPELMNRFFDIMSVQKGLSKILIDFSAAALQVVFGLILLSFYHPFFIIFSFILVVLVYVIFRYTSVRGLKTSIKESKHKYELAHWLEEVARTATSFKLAGDSNLPLEKVDGHVGSYIEARQSHFKILVQQFSMMVLFKVIVATGLLIIGGLLVIEQRMNIGQFVAAEIIILLVINSVEKLVLSLETIYDVLTSLEKVGEVTDLTLDTNEGIDLCKESSGKGLEIMLDKVVFAYPGYSKNTIEELSLTISKGEKLMIAGQNGSGKSTLLNLISGLFDVQKGTISYNGFAKNNLQMNSLRTEIGGYLSHEQLFEGTVTENISVGRSSVPFENVKWAAEKLGLSEFIKTLPKGYDSPLDPLGKKLPRSVVSKILLARSIASKPKLLLLENAFESIDEIDVVKIIDFLTDKSNNWTMVSISSNRHLAERCDKIVFMNRGSILKYGTYEEMKEIINFINL
ncbi:peptidase domain-containing ABC transporter [Acidiluteibacter ferrifornacis]|uniref:ATP-binding cassette domain-containing protein n=1 Tax=Acidiluteibacter ferrifornacis TaxID=2692424 RepID=A0A6N9NIL0_9FLAO|nr:ABC transporter ATP-binding protein [Acidiluteibacter ferrifornacis]MBR9832747.1 ABC transporter ATP-binding protein [bacterium]NBG65679.1 ATP-binding cassette domain-containing protein [Acidiluteibacter ferrifornacis]